MDSTSKTSPRLSARERIVETAMKRFYRDGLRATGIDPIIAESKVAKMSFYRHFPSKNHLIAECLGRRHESWMTWFSEEMEAKLTQSSGSLEVIADVLRLWFEQPDFRGCAFINAKVETPEGNEVIDTIIQDHKEAVESLIFEYAVGFNYVNAKQTAKAIMVIMEGTIVRAQMEGSSSICDACSALLKKFGRNARRPESNEDSLNEQLFLPGIEF